MSELYNVSASPHIQCNTSTKTIMRDVVIALIPATLFGIFNFGLNALILILATVASAVLTEYLYEKGMKKPITTGDYSAVVTGLLLALNLPSSIPIWMAVLGSVFAILVVKQLFGGLGQNFMNPALAGRCFLLLSFTKQMTNFGIAANDSKNAIIHNGLASIRGYAMVDGVSSATPLMALKEGKDFNLLDMFLGTTAGTIGETSALAILIGAAYLLLRKVISIKIPAIYIGTVALFALCTSLAKGNGFDINFVVGHLVGGGLMLGAFFMATDYVTCPITPLGKVVFAILLGIFTGLFRVFGNNAEGVSYAIIFCNLLVPLIEKVTLPKAFGKGAKKDGE